jgi:fibro-slime domain-containing protein
LVLKLFWIGGALALPAVLMGAHPVLPGVERLLAKDQVAAGKLLVGELNCNACHGAGDSSKQLLERRSPKLTGVTERIEVDYLKRFLADPQGTKPGTLMPKMFRPGDAGKIEAVVAYLESVEGDALPAAQPHGGAAKRGFDLFRKSGCVACHAPRDKKGKELPFAGGESSVPMGDLTGKYTLEGLTAFLKDPMKFRPSGRMPSFRLDDRNAATLASFLTGKKARGGAATGGERPGEDGKVVSYKMVKTNGNVPKAFDKDPETGTLGGLMLRSKWSGDNFAVEYESWFYAERDGNYTFYTKSDDDSFLYVNDAKVVDNGGVHPAKEAKGNLKLKKGHHKLRVVYNERSGNQSMEAYVSGSKLPKQYLSHRLLSLDKKVPEPVAGAEEIVDEPPVDQALIAKGRELYKSMGCASCHELKENNARVKSALKAKPLRQLGAGDCAGTPEFSLSDAQKSALVAGLKALKTGAEPTVADRVKHRFAAMNCYACHDRDGIGGPTSARAELFLSKEDDMGPEGHLPPGLTGVGAKLKTAALKQVLTDNRLKDDKWPRYDYLEVKMPYFGKRNVEHLIADLQAADGAPKESEDNGGDVAAGKLLVGNKGLGCVTCHQYNTHKALGIQGLDLTNMTNRVSQDWFKKWLLAPQKIRETTRMPSFWPDGHAANREVLGGDTDKQIAAIWAFLGSKPQGRPPAGIQIKNLMLVEPTEKPEMYRNFYTKAGSRGIGVAYPEGVNLLFDANYNRLLQVWRDEFVNAGIHWVARGQGTVAPYGGDVVDLFHADPVSFLKADELWPRREEHKGDIPGKKADMRFRGYELNKKGQPTFRYTKGKVHISELFEPVKKGDKVVFKRTVRLSSVEAMDGLHWLVARGKEVTQTGDAWKVGSSLTLRLGGEGWDDARKLANEGGFDVVLPVAAGRRTAVLEQMIEW